MCNPTADYHENSLADPKSIPTRGIHEMKLIILCIYDKLTGWSPKEFELPTEFESQSQAELRALLWLSYRPNDLVMLVPA